MPLKGVSPISPSLGNTSPNYFKRFFTTRGRTLGYEIVAVHVSAPLQIRRLRGCSDRRIFLLYFFYQLIKRKLHLHVH